MPTKGQYTRVHDEDEDEFAQLARDRSPPPPGTSPSDDDDSEPRGGRQNSNPLSVVESPQPINQTEQALRDEIARLRHENAELREKKAAQGANPEDAEAGGTTADSDDGKDQPQNQGRVTELGLLPDGTRINHKLVLATVSLNAILVMSCNTMFLPALNTVQMDLNTTTTMAALCLTVYTMGSAIQPLVMGPISDVIGRRKPMLVAHCIFITASIAAYAAPSIEALLAARTLEALGGCTFVVIGQGQVGDIYPRDQLGKALSWFSLSRMFAALGGPVVGGFICQFFGWRSTFLLCAILDTILATVCYFHVPETLLTPKESRPQLAWSIPIRPLAEIVKDRSVGLVCFLGALNHGLVYMVALLVPKIGALLTFNESVIGLFMVPVTCGTVMGSLLGGKFLSRSGGKYKEWKGMRLGMCLAATAAILFGSVILSICGDDMTFARVLNSTAWELGGSGSLSGEDDDAAAAAAWAAAGNSTPTAETVPRSVVDWRGYSRDEMNAVDATDSYIVLDSRKWDPFDPVLGMRQTNFRIEHGQLCTAEKWRWQWILPTVLVQFAIGFGGSLAMVAATTYLALSRPDTRASVAASQRCTQQVGAAGSVLLCGFLFDNRSFGPPRAGAALGIGVLVALALLLGCVKREPAPKSNSALAQPRSSSGTPVKLVQRGGAYSPGKL